MIFLGWMFTAESSKNVISFGILNWIQTGYDSRLGATEMPVGLQKSPQTESQKSFVKSFVQQVQKQYKQQQQKSCQK